MENKQTPQYRQKTNKKPQPLQPLLSPTKKTLQVHTSHVALKCETTMRNWKLVLEVWGTFGFVWLPSRAIFSRQELALCTCISGSIKWWCLMMLFEYLSWFLRQFINSTMEVLKILRQFYVVFRLLKSLCYERDVSFQCLELLGTEPSLDWLFKS